MQDLIIEKPYRFVRPARNSLVLWMTCTFNLFHHWLRKVEGVYEFEVRNSQKLKDSIAAGHGIVVSGNHCRNADPLAVGEVAKAANCYMYSMASWHLFNQGRFMAWALKNLGAFSINREGLDRTALDYAINVLVQAKRPLVIFPEGSVSRSNDYLHPFLDGTGFIARTAARRRRKTDPHSKVVIHPVIFRYHFIGDFQACTEHTLGLLEKHLKTTSDPALPLLDRIQHVSTALLGERESVYLGQVQNGSYYDRIEHLAEHILEIQEIKWKGAVQSGSWIPRVKALRPLIVPDLANGLLDEQESNIRRQDLFDLNFVQQLSYYPPDYLSPSDGRLTRERILEMLERLEEDLTDQVTMPRRFKLILDILDPIEVPAEKGPRGGVTDPLMEQVRSRMLASLSEHALESEPFVP